MRWVVFFALGAAGCSTLDLDSLRARPMEAGVDGTGVMDATVSPVDGFCGAAEAGYLLCDDFTPGRDAGWTRARLEGSKSVNALSDAEATSPPFSLFSSTSDYNGEACNELELPPASRYRVEFRLKTVSTGRVKLHALRSANDTLHIDQVGATTGLRYQARRLAADGGAIEYELKNDKVADLDARWHHVALELDFTASTVSLWVDGARDIQDWPLVPKMTGPLRYSAGITDTNYNAKGVCFSDDVLVYVR